MKFARAPPARGTTQKRIGPQCSRTERRTDNPGISRQRPRPNPIDAAGGRMMEEHASGATLRPMLPFWTSAGIPKSRPPPIGSVRYGTERPQRPSQRARRTNRQSCSLCSMDFDRNCRRRGFSAELADTQFWRWSVNADYMRAQAYGILGREKRNVSAVADCRGISRETHSCSLALHSCGARGDPSIRNGRPATKDPSSFTPFLSGAN